MPIMQDLPGLAKTIKEVYVSDVAGRRMPGGNPVDIPAGLWKWQCIG
jgi:hypothetical protein